MEQLLQQVMEQLLQPAMGLLLLLLWPKRRICRLLLQ
jgi:hypothetical protein